MKIGIRNFNLKNRIKARTTAKVKRKVKGKLFPWYGKAGMGWIRNPKKAFYDLIYKRTTVSVDDVGEAINKVEQKEVSSTSLLGYIFKTIGMTIFQIVKILVIIFGGLIICMNSINSFADKTGTCGSKRRRKKY